MFKRKLFPDHFYNPITLIGAGIALLSFAIFIFLVILEFFAHTTNPYLGIITFIILPSILILGLLMIAFGIIKERKRMQRTGEKARELPRIDLNNPKHRLASLIFVFGTIILLFFSAFGSYKAYEYTESDEFCGTLCHEVMHPEFTAYQQSPHSRVGCVKCHIGSGADWFVKAKISGSYQVYSVLFNKYSRPIETPIRDLRPAQETCEQCHWPKHFFSEKRVDYHYFNSDENNTHSSVTMLLKIGGGNHELGTVSGIHYHMNLANDIYYYAEDFARSSIPLIKVVHKNGEEEIFRAKGKENLQLSELSSSLRKMDCIDCHNRPAHIYNEPSSLLNLKMAQKSIDPYLPYIKSISMKALEIPYTTKKVALDSIQMIVNDFYEINYPLTYKNKREEIQKSIDEIKKIYEYNYFPEMRVSWKYYPEHIGHITTPGCFRCHDDNHVSNKGRTISKDCNVCHQIIAQTLPDGTKQVSMDGLKYFHPTEIGNALYNQDCSDCHIRER